MHRDSLDKIKMYLDNINQCESIVISPKFFRQYKCFENCGGCCLQYSMDFLDFEFSEFKKIYPEYEHLFKKREDIPVYSLKQKDSGLCQLVDSKTGWCKIHDFSPFSCQFELNKISYNSKTKQTTLIKRLFGRSWNFNCVDGSKGGKCKMIDDYTQENFIYDISLYKKLLCYAKLLKCDTQRLEDIIDFFEHLLNENILSISQKIVLRRKE